jgi:hypothetical protein
MNEDEINKMLADSGVDLNKNVKRSKRKDIDFVL